MIHAEKRVTGEAILIRDRGPISGLPQFGTDDHEITLQSGERWLGIAAQSEGQLVRLSPETADPFARQVLREAGSIVTLGVGIHLAPTQKEAA